MAMNGDSVKAWEHYQQELDDYVTSLPAVWTDAQHNHFLFLRALAEPDPNDAEWGAE